MHLLNQARRIVVGISGGVDSAVSAYLLKKRFEVIGVFMRNWDIVEETGICSAEKDLCDAQEVCKFLDIPFHEANFVKEYWIEVFEELIKDYQSGLTPNPDILCNKHIKFNHFIDFALNKLNANTIATGHYARTVVIDNGNSPRAKLFKAYDILKDQTLFLSQISQHALSRTIFPLGKLLKFDVKQIALDIGFKKIAKKKESVGICFIGRRNFKDFISEYITLKEGNFIDIDTGKIVGQHSGKHHWTLGQRCRIGGSHLPYYIAMKNENEDIYIAKGHDHPALFSDCITAGPAHWIDSEPIDLKNFGLLECEFRFQHRSPCLKCLVYKLSNNRLFVELDKPLRALTPGQYAVFYKDEECLGSARILNSSPSYHILNKNLDNVNKIYY